jgi:hypothetical protein
VNPDYCIVGVKHASIYRTGPRCSTQKTNKKDKEEKERRNRRGYKKVKAIIVYTKIESGILLQI